MNFSFVNKLIPKRNIVSFSSFPDFADNAKAIFDYMCLHYETELRKYKLIWHGENVPSMIKLLGNDKYRDYKIEVKRSKSLSSIWNFLRSSVVFSTHGCYKKLGCSKKQTHVCLWHGMPIKKIGYLNSKDIHKGIVKADFYIVTSRMFQQLFMDIFHAEKEQILVTGQPRNDILFDDWKDTPFISGIFREFDAYYCFLPTYRKTATMLDGKADTEKSFLGGSAADWKKLNELLTQKNALLIVKPHPLALLASEHFLDGLDNIRILTDCDLESNDTTLYQILSQTSGLITDYSSVYIDYLLLNKPICFYASDIEEYSKSRGFIFNNITDYMPGEMGRDFDVIGRFLFSTEDLYEKKRRSVNKIFNEVNDASASSNLLEILAKLKVL